MSVISMVFTQQQSTFFTRSIHIALLSSGASSASACVWWIRWMKPSKCVFQSGDAMNSNVCGGPYAPHAFCVELSFCSPSRPALTQCSPRFVESSCASVRK